MNALDMNLSTAFGMSGTTEGAVKGWETRHGGRIASHTFAPDDSAAVAGKTFYDGTIIQTPNGAAVRFMRPLINGKAVVALIGSRPALAKVAEDAQSRYEADSKAASDKAESDAREASKPVWVERRLVTELQNKAERLRDNPGSYFAAKAKAERALADWRSKYPGEAARSDREYADHVARENARLERQYKDSFVYKGID